jgi:RHS repeat-associated protein
VLVEKTGTNEVIYTFGDDLVSQERNGAVNFYHYDGLGSTRALSDANGFLTDTYAYEAFGKVLNQTGATENSYLFTGEQFDQDLDQYYLRARYYDQGTGRFTQQDTWMGRDFDPITLNKYVYANADPANNIDPTGNFSMGSVMSAINILQLWQVQLRLHTVCMAPLQMKTGLQLRRPAGLY